MVEGDNPPVGILLCTARDAEHVEFATAGLDNYVFVSKYRLALPTEEELKVFIQKELQKQDINGTNETSGETISKNRAVRTGKIKGHQRGKKGKLEG